MRSVRVDNMKFHLYTKQKKDQLSTIKVAIICV